VSPRLDGFTVVEVHDPAEMDERSRISRRLPGRHNVHTYTLRDPSLRRSGAGKLLARHVGRQAGDLLLVTVAERFGREIGIVDPGIPAYCFALIRSGRMAVSPPDTRGTIEAGPGQGIIQGGRAGMRALTADGTARTNFFIAASRFESALQSCLGEPLRAPLVFAPALDWESSAGAGLRPFDRAFRRELKKVFPRAELVKLPPTHPLFSGGWNPVEHVSYTPAALRDNPDICPAFRTRLRFVSV